MDFVSIIQLALAALTALVGYPTLVALVVSILEKYNWLPVDKVDVFNFWANAVAFVGIVVLAFFGKIDLVNQIDSQLGQLAKLVVEVLILLGIPYSFTSARKQYFHLREGLIK